MASLRVDGKRVVITAGATGIGRITAAALRDAGALLHVSDVDDKALAELRAAMPGVHTLACDVADSAAVDRLFQDAARMLGGVDILVNNAGIAGPTKAVEDITDEEWNRTLGVNITGMFYCTRRAVPLLKTAGGGAIVNLSSAAGRFGFPMRSPYSASKWAVVGFTQTIAREVGPFNIRVNAILPGPVAGERIDRVIRAKAEARGVSFEAQRAEYVGTTAMLRLTEPADVANMILYLVSDLGRHLSGQAIGVDAGTFIIS